LRGTSYPGKTSEENYNPNGCAQRHTTAKRKENCRNRVAVDAVLDDDPR